MNVLSEYPIGVFDSGVGGISVLADLVKLMPHEHFWYFGDTLHAPYGTKSPDEVRGYCMDIAQQMLKLPVKAIVIACNTASSAGAQLMRDTFDLPIIAMEPALKPASEMRHGGRILVMATPNTLRLPKFQQLYARYGAGAVPVPCPGLMEYVENMDDQGARKYLQDLFSSYFDKGPVDAVVLGCTHYVFLKPLIRELLPPQTAVIDGNAGTARQLRRVLESRDLLAQEGLGTVSFHTSLPDTPETQKKQELERMQILYARAHQIE